MALTKKQIEGFKETLLEMRRDIRKTLDGQEAEVKRPDEATGYSQHQADQGTDDFDRTINLEVTSTEYSILRQIDRALEKIEEGTYGICDLTQEEIPLARLQAVPHATMTVQAQEKLEKGLI
ncbi:MAG: TraR/DksA family transcriptional regulator [Chlamydiia bacterium]|nr:TraR/DksA family transcriptional regulator [Chlamydiia bacterium]